MQREIDLDEALRRLRESMKPLRSYLGQVPYREESHALTDVTDNVSKASKAIQAERRKLWKMKTREAVTN